jgi:pimeloyl-ACP methyl ester carboxylesterase
MKENATLTAGRNTGAAQMASAHLVALMKAGKIDEIHLAGHSAGAILLAHLAKFLASKQLKIKSVSLWAPACTMELFDDFYRPLIQSGDIEAFDLYTLDDATERDDDCANIYHKSLLYLVSGAFEQQARIPLRNPNGTPLLGLARDAAGIPKSFWTSKRRWIVAPGDAGSKARHHGDFDNDEATLLTALKRITSEEVPSLPAVPMSVPSAAGRVRTRRLVEYGLSRP